MMLTLNRFLLQQLESTRVFIHVDFDYILENGDHIFKSAGISRALFMNELPGADLGFILTQSLIRLV